MSWMRPWLCVLIFAASAAAAQAPPSPNIILITLDTVRADRMGFLGSRLALTPSLDALARQSVVFTRAYSQAPLTTASHASILTGTYPQFHHVNDFGVTLAADLPFAPDILRTRGYQTAAFIGSLILDPVAKSAPGFDRGFDTFDAGFHQRHPGENRYQSMERRGGDVVDRVLAWLAKDRERPFFIWIHLYDAHDPYDPPEPFKSRYVASPYDGEIAYVDSEVGKLLRQLRARGIYDRSLIAVMSDHGEALGEHGELAHGIFLYDETIHVPLLFKFPQAKSAGKHIDTRVRLVDVLPTILNAVGIPIPKEVQGKSLLALLKPHLPGLGTAERDNILTHDRPSYAETDYPLRAFGWSPLRSLRTGKYLFVDSPRKEVYDQAADPGAQRNLVASSSAVAGTLATQLDTFRENTRRSGESSKPQIDADLQEKLSALGYVAGGGGLSTLPGIKETGADPKDKIEVVNLLHRAELLEEDSRFAEAVPLLEQAVAREPDIPIAYLKLGTALSILRNYAKAVPVLRKAVELRPDLTAPRFQLGSALFETGDFAPAAAAYESALARAPEWAEARFSLATTYARMGHMPDAITEYRKVIAARPRHYGAHLLLGRALALSGNAEAALPELIEASNLHPDSAEPHLFLAHAYESLGRNSDAERERGEAARLTNRNTSPTDIIAPE